MTLWPHKLHASVQQAQEIVHQNTIGAANSLVLRQAHCLGKKDPVHQASTEPPDYSGIAEDHGSAKLPHSVNF
jgi:hypothetical protein